VKWHSVSGVDLSSPRHAWLNKEHELTAHDFVFFLDMLMHPDVQNGFIKSYYSELASWKALDDYTLEIKWSKTQAHNIEFSMISPLPKFLYAYAEDGTPIPGNALGLTFNNHWYNNKGLVGTGPYRFAEYTPGVQMRLERNEDYFGELPAIKSVRFPIYTDRTQTVLKLRSGELSFGQLRAGQYREEVLQYQDMPEDKRPKDSPFLNGQIKCDVVDQPVFYYLGWNADNPLFSDKRVRRAMTLALNRSEIVTKVFSGLGKVSRGPFLETTPHLAPEIQPLPYDLKQASALLQEAGWADANGDGLLEKSLGGKITPFEFTLLIYGSAPEWTSAANIFKEDLLSIGVKMNIDAADWSLMQKRMAEKKFDAFTGAWALSWVTDPHQIWHSSQADVPKGSNRVGFRNAKADAIIDELRITLDLDKRTELYRDFHRIIHDEQPYSFVYNPKLPYCYRGLEAVVYSKVRPVANIHPWWSTRVEG
jgi:ABC-type transport system substrate-binding protein